MCTPQHTVLGSVLLGLTLSTVYIACGGLFKRLYSRKCTPRAAVLVAAALICVICAVGCTIAFVEWVRLFPCKIPAHLIKPLLLSSDSNLTLHVIMVSFLTCAGALLHMSAVCRLCVLLNKQRTKRILITLSATITGILSLITVSLASSVYTFRTMAIAQLFYYGMMTPIIAGYTLWKANQAEVECSKPSVAANRIISVFTSTNKCLTVLISIIWIMGGISMLVLSENSPYSIFRIIVYTLVLCTVCACEVIYEYIFRALVANLVHHDSIPSCYSVHMTIVREKIDTYQEYYYRPELDSLPRFPSPPPPPPPPHGKGNIVDGRLMNSSTITTRVG